MYSFTYRKECVICYNSLKDTIVLPCRHLCICRGCAEIANQRQLLSNNVQHNKCPICRTKVTTYMHIKVTKETLVSDKTEGRISEETKAK